MLNIINFNKGKRVCLWDRREEFSYLQPTINSIETNDSYQLKSYFRKRINFIILILRVNSVDPTRFNTVPFSFSLPQFTHLLPSTSTTFRSDSSCTVVVHRLLFDTLFCFHEGCLRTSFLPWTDLGPTW